MGRQVVVSLVTHQKTDKYKMDIVIVCQDMAMLMSILNNVKVLIIYKKFAHNIVSHVAK